MNRPEPYIYIILALLLLTACKHPKKAQTISQILNSNISLDSIQINTPKDIYIHIKNIGDNDLEISKIQPSCKCISNDLQNKNIMPKEVDSIKITLLPNEYGNFEETVAIISNTEKKFDLIKIKYQVLK
jgi:hypothetical protein